MFDFFKKKKTVAETTQVDVKKWDQSALDNVAKLKQIILDRPDLKQRMMGASPLDVFLIEVVALSREQGVPFTKDDFLAYAERTGNSLPAVCMAYFGGGF